MSIQRFFLFLAFAGLLIGQPFSVHAQIKPSQTVTIENSKFKAAFNKHGLSAFRVKNDTVNLVSDNRVWGNVVVRYRVNKEDWNNLTTDFTRFTQTDEGTFIYTDSLIDMPLCMKRFYTLKENGLHLRIEISATGKQPIELGDVALPVHWRPHGRDEADPTSIFERGFIQKHNISLNSSFLTFSKPSGTGPFYLMMTQGNTPLEYFDNNHGSYTAYIHAGCTGPGTEGNWRMPHTTRELAPAGNTGAKVVYEFLLTSASRYEDIRNLIYEEGLLDIRVAPGYTMPRDLTARIAFRTKGKISRIEAEHPEQTEITEAGVSPDGYLLYDIKFHRLGENLLTVYYNKDEKTVLEFFSTEPMETLIKKRSSFIVNSQQHKVPGQWWDGLYSIFDMKYSKLRGPEDTDGYNGWFGYMLATDDPILPKAPYVAAKNVVYPDSAEIASIEYYLENFVWGKLQAANDEPYPYAIYGVPNWPIARNSVLNAAYNHFHSHLVHIWRAYDYPHIIKLYYHMYQIASMLPQWTNYLDADGYFERAVQTTYAYFKYPYEILPWFETYKWGIYNERFIPEIIAELEKRGRDKDATYLRGEWEKKAKYFIYDDKYPFRSEYSFDRTAFESSYALAKYAIEHPMKPDKNLWYDKSKKRWYSHPRVSVADARSFMDRQHYAGLSVRGWHAPKYYLAGADCASSDHTHDMSYMAMMAGWSILDYGLLYSDNMDWIELGYNSYLSSWSLLNSGDAASNYGYWYPGKEKDGAAGQAFMSAKNGMTWIRKHENRGAWRYDGEIDLGFGATFHTARTIIIRDSVFGWHAYGSDLQIEKSRLSVIPKDGVRKQFSYITPEFRYHLSLDKDGMKGNVPVQVTMKGKQTRFILENKIYTALRDEKSASHTTTIQIRTQETSPQKMTVSGKVVPLLHTPTGWKADLPVVNPEGEIIIHWK